MKLFAPKYYGDFACIADRCRHSCCIGWEIDVDEDSLGRYDRLACEYAEEIRQSIDREDGVPHFRLAKQERCPHLNAAGLCNIILHCGEDLLCEICREHPRFYHDTSRGKEVGLGMACEEACRLILQSDAFGELIELEELDGEVMTPDFDALPLRARLFAILRDPQIDRLQRLARIADEYGVSADAISRDVSRTLLQGLEYLDEAHRKLFGRFCSTPSVSSALDRPLARALAYFVFRHCTAAMDEADFCASLGFAVFCECLLASIAAANQVQDIDALAEYARIISEELEYSEENTEAIKSVFDPSFHP